MQPPPTDSAPDPADELPELDLDDQDILEAMRQIPGYLDISTSDFRAIYHLAHAHALDRLFGRLRAGALMRQGILPLRPDLPLDQAARALVQQGLKSLPVVDDDRRVVGILTETDFLRRLQADSFLDLLLRLLEQPGGFSQRCHATPVSAAMTAPAVTVPQGAGFRAILGAFHAHPGRGMPVVDEAGRSRGLLLRKDFLAVLHLEEWR